jgi:predicted transcriptional regulator
MNSCGAHHRRAIAASGITVSQLAGQTGVPQPTMTKRLAGADMRISNAAKIASHLRAGILK